MTISHSYPSDIKELFKHQLRTLTIFYWITTLQLPDVRSSQWNRCFTVTKKNQAKHGPKNRVLWLNQLFVQHVSWVNYMVTCFIDNVK